MKEIFTDREDPIGLLLQYCFKWALFGCSIIAVIGLTVKLFMILFP